MMQDAPSPKSDSGIRDNHKRGSVSDFLSSKIQSDSSLSFVSAYFTIYAYAKMKDQLDQIGHLRFLFGEPRFVQSLDPDKTDKKAFNIEDRQLQLSNRLEQKQIARECSEWIRDKTDIRSIKKPGFLHGKMYHIDNGGVEEAILGSSNFTVSGLGFGGPGSGNLELNLEVNDRRDQRDLLAWFNEIWDDESLVEDVKEEVLRYLEQLYQNHSPEFIYFKTLYHIFEDYLSGAEQGGLLNEKTGFFETLVWQKLYEFQKDGVKGAINKVLTHHGCILADSVGLGKTFEALAVIKYFELQNERVLVLCPKKLEANWLQYRENDSRNTLLKDRFAFDVKAHTDLGRDALSTWNWGNYGLVVIDESHNFRNNAPGKKQDDGTRNQTRYEFLMQEVMQSGIDTKVLLLSATPVNTSLKDLRNQVYLMTGDDDGAFADSLNISSISRTIQNAQRAFTDWAKPDRAENRTLGNLLEKLDSGFFKLLDGLTIARSRKHIEKYYDLSQIGAFPERLPPLVRAPEIDNKKLFPDYDEVYALISKFDLSVYNPSKYLHSEHVDHYAESQVQAELFNDQKTREFYLIGMMRVNFLKRLESSIYSFRMTLTRTIEKVDTLLDKIDHFDQHRAEYTQADLFDTEDDEELEALRETLEVGKKIRFRLEHLNLEDWKKDLKKDRAQLLQLKGVSEDVTPDRDRKLDELKVLISEKLQHPINPGNRKALVFTAYSDTADYLYRNLEPWAREEKGIHIGLVVGTGDNKTTFRSKGFKAQAHFNAILTNFSPRAKGRADMPDTMPQEGEIDLLIASDCISEGQNLQDCDFLVNYDIHWNPVRIIQRFGRIDRLGSVNKAIQLVNFWPTPDLNRYIKLKDRVETRMALVDLSATGEDDLLNNEQLKDLLQDELSYREKQLMRLKDEVLDLEDLDESLSLSEFTLDDFRIELMNYLEANKEALRDAPLGLYAVVPTLEESLPPDLFDRNWQEIVKPGVVYCLRQRTDEGTKDRNSVNPLQPHYLLYIREDGTVRFNFVNAKQCLSLLQKICVGKTTPWQELCDAFDEETQHGQDMSSYNRLLNKAVAAIARSFQKRVASGLQTGRDFVIPAQEQQVRDEEDFELITWVVIR
jgi:SNF2 family DNA or RNA helicase